MIIIFSGEAVRWCVIKIFINCCPEVTNKGVHLTFIFTQNLVYTDFMHLLQIYMMTSSNGDIFRITGRCKENPPVASGFPSQRPVTLSFDIFFDVRLNKRLNKQSRRWWFETPWRSLWRHCNGNLTKNSFGELANFNEPPPGARYWNSPWL